MQNKKHPFLIIIPILMLILFIIKNIPGADYFFSDLASGKSIKYSLLSVKAESLHNHNLWNDTPESIKAEEKTLARMETLPEAKNDLRFHYLKLHIYSKYEADKKSDASRIAIDEYNKMLEIIKNDPMAFSKSRLGNSFRDADDLIAYCHYRIGIAYFNLKEYKKSTDAFTYAINNHPDIYAVYSWRAWAEYENKDYNAAYSDYKKEMSIRNDCLKMYNCHYTEKDLVQNQSNIYLCQRRLNILPKSNPKTISDNNIMVILKDLKINGNLEKLPLNPQTNLNYKTKNEIFKIRNSYVQKSMLKNSKYDPAKSPVFQNMKNKREWFGQNLHVKSLDEKNPDGTWKYNLFRSPENISFDSLYLNNPNLVVTALKDEANIYGLEHGVDEVIRWKQYDIPTSFQQVKPSKIPTFVVTHDFGDYLDTARLGYVGDQSKYKFYLNGLNALDLGYKWVYADSSNNIRFDSQYNISKEPLVFNAELNTYECGLEHGCNAYGEYQKETGFYFIKHPKTTQSYISLKLWKIQPVSAEQEPDARIILIFR